MQTSMDILGATNVTLEAAKVIFGKVFISDILCHPEFLNVNIKFYLNYLILKIFV